MKKRTQALLLVLCAVLLVAGSVLGTMAYLTDTEKVTNTFTVGKVGIKLTEAVTNEYGVPVDPAERTEGAETTDIANTYKLIPNHTYTKDPMVTVDADSEESYVRILMTINEKAALDAIGFDMLKVFKGYDSTKWLFQGQTEGTDSMTYEFRYYQTVSTVDGEALDLDPLFDELWIPEYVTNAQLETMGDMTISLVAHAIQADGFTTADAAWAVFDGQKNR